MNEFYNNKEMFDQSLKTFFEINKDKFEHIFTERDEVIRRIIKLGIKKVAFGKDLGEDLSKINTQKDLTIIIYPQMSIINLVEKYNEKLIQELTREDTNNRVILDFFYNMIPTETKCIELKGLLYIPQKNIIICAYNPLSTKSFFELFEQTCIEMKVESLDQEKIHLKKLIEGFNYNARNRIRILQNEINSRESNIDSYRIQIINSLNEIKERKDNEKLLLTSLDTTETLILEEIQKARKVPFLKTFELGDWLKISFGDIYINHKVITGVRTTARGLKQPIVEMKKIFIGDLEFSIKESTVKVFNRNNKIGEFEHPHCVNGRICFGTDTFNIAKLTAEFKFTELIKNLYQWCISYNEGYAHCNIQRFYDAKNPPVNIDERVPDQQKIATFMEAM